MTASRAMAPLLAAVLASGLLGCRSDEQGPVVSKPQAAPATEFPSSDDPVVLKVRALTAEACNCGTADCAEQVHQRMRRYLDTQTGASANRASAAAIGREMARLAGCKMKFQGAATPP